MSGPNWEEPRSALGVLADTLRLYRRFPLLFLVLAAAVLVPYEAILLAATGAGPGGQSGGLSFLLSIVDFGLVTPLISALHVHAVVAVREGERPQIAVVARRGLRVLPAVAATTIAATLGMIGGFLLLVVPGVILWLRWFVAAQAAAVEGEGWQPALRRSAALTADNYRHVFAVLLVVLVASVPAILIHVAFGIHSETPLALLVNLAVGVVEASFAALVGAVLYFELRVRLRARQAGAPDLVATRPLGPGGIEAVQTSLDPRVHSDEERPRGWYVDPASPRRMHYWGGPGADGWVSGTRTPRKMRLAWEVEVGLRRRA